jgi:transcriptional regulator with XRE-family HTH domain
MNIAQHLATTLKTLRQQRGWSLSRLAEETGVSKAMLGQVERNESSPTVATLWKIATGLNVPFSAFIVADESTAPTAFDPQQQAMVVTPFSRGTRSCVLTTSRLLSPRRAQRIHAARERGD